MIIATENLLIIILYILWLKDTAEVVTVFILQSGHPSATNYLIPGMIFSIEIALALTMLPWWVFQKSSNQNPNF